jgi:hypothetical protein
MKYLVCVFHDGKLVKTQRDLLETQLPFILENTSIELDIPVEELSYKKYDESAICEYCMPSRRPKKRFRILVDKIELLERVSEEYETTIEVDILTHDLAELQNLYSVEDYNKIIQNREYVNNLDPVISYNPEVSIELPHYVTPVEIPTIATRFVEVVVEHILPLEE